MASLIATLARSLSGSRPELVCDTKVWDAGVAELRRRAGGYRESGAFLLGTRSKLRRIEEFVFYDDVDPNALRSGIVNIDGRRLGELWSLCRQTGREVVADIHVHPGGYQQSPSDKANPVIAQANHFALILPHYAARAAHPGRIGIHQYLGAKSWRDRSHDNPLPFHVGWWPSWN